MEQKHVGINLKPLGFDQQLAVMLEGESLEGVGELHCAINERGVWKDYPFTVTDDTGTLFNKSMLEEYAAAGCEITEIMRCQKLVERAGYQWREHSRPVSDGEGREYIVAITRSLSQYWTETSPNVTSCGYREDRVSCWRALMMHAELYPAAGSETERDAQNATAAVTA